jgi:predicted DNA-binding transcriptional regulator AlpA
MDNNAAKRWLSRRELADRLGLPVKTLAWWASNGTGPPYARMVRHVRYRISDVIDWETARVDDNLGGGAQPDTLANHELAPVADSGISNTGFGDGGNDQ